MTELERQIVKACDEIDRLRDANTELVNALKRVDGINDNPADYNEEINRVVMAALAKSESR